jgi:hypothetical protein
MTLPKGLKKIIKKIKKQNSMVRVVLVLVVLYLLFTLFKKMRWIVGNNSYLEGLVSSDKTFVFFKMNGCPHCVKMEPEWAKFEKVCPSSIKTKTLEAGANKKEAKEYGVSGFPSLLMVSGGKVIDTYNGERNAGGFAKFAAKHK